MISNETEVLPVSHVPLLEVKNLKTHFLTERGKVTAVNGVSFRDPSGGDRRNRWGIGLRQERHVPIDHPLARALGSDRV